MEHSRQHYYGLAVLDALDNEGHGHGGCVIAKKDLRKKAHALMTSESGEAGRLFSMVAEMHAIAVDVHGQLEGARLEEVARSLGHTWETRDDDKIEEVEVDTDDGEDPDYEE